MNNRLVLKSVLPDMIYRHRCLALVLLLVALLIAFMLPAMPVGTWRDDGTYYTYAHSLLQGKGLRMIYLPNEPLYPVVPVGYPLMLAPLVQIFPLKLMPLQILTSLFLLGSIVVLYAYLIRYIDRTKALMVVALFGTNVTMIVYASQILSEIPFIFAVLVSVFFVERFVNHESPTWLDVVGTALTIGLPVSFRYLGLPIVLGLILYIVWKRRDRYALWLIVLGVTIILALNLGVGGWELAEYVRSVISTRLTIVTAPPNTFHQQPIGTRYLQGWYLMASTLIPSNQVPLFEGPRIKMFFEQIGLGFIPGIFQVGITLLMFYGLVRRLLTRIHAAELVFCIYVLTLVLLPTDWAVLSSRFRYWVPIIPLGYLYLLEGFQSLSAFLIRERLFTRHSVFRGRILYLLFSSLFLLNLARNVQQSVLNPLQARIPDLNIGREWINEHTSIDDVIMVELPRREALYINRIFAPYPGTPTSWERRFVYEGVSEWQRDPSSEAALSAVVDQFSVDYILVQPLDLPDVPLQWTSYVEEELLPILEFYPSKFVLEREANEGYTRIYRVRP